MSSAEASKAQGNAHFKVESQPLPAYTKMPPKTMIEMRMRMFIIIIIIIIILIVQGTLMMSNAIAHQSSIINIFNNNHKS